jgi:hypothetical protein
MANIIMKSGGGGGWGEVRDKNPVLGRRVFRSITKDI